MKKAVYPGTFDPITLGHLEIIIRAMKIFDKIILAVAADCNKDTTFTLNERLTLATQAVSNLPNVKAVSFTGLIADFAKIKRAKILIRGLRTVSDFEYESQLSHVNNYLSPTLESVFFIPSPNFSFISSSLVKEIARHGGNIKNLLPDSILQPISEKLSQI